MGKCNTQATTRWKFGKGPAKRMQMKLAKTKVKDKVGNDDEIVS